MTRGQHFMEAFAQLNVLIVGDVMIDRYHVGKVSRISPEAPVPVVHLQSTENRLGGAANVALNIHALGATPILCSVVGDDADGETFTNLLTQRGLGTRGILSSKERMTTVKSRVLAQSQHLLRVDRENTEDLSKTEAKRFLSQIREIIDSRDIHLILFQDYNKGVLSQHVISELLLEAIKNDIKTAVDPKYHNFWSYKHVDLFKPNLKEVQDCLEMPIQATLDSLEMASTRIRQRIGNAITLITLSERGLYVNQDGNQAIFPTQPRVIADVCGAGDTVISVAGLGLAAGLDIDTIAVLSNLAGGQVCERVGVVPVDQTILAREYQQHLGQKIHS
ncbi:MAG: bifunctional ADP-heptose synthase [Bacteroidota bacterium]